MGGETKAGIVVDPGDLMKMCDALIQDHKHFVSAGCSRSDYDRYVCNCCSEDAREVYREPYQDIVHLPDCVVLIAERIREDILFGKGFV